MLLPRVLLEFFICVLPLLFGLTIFSQWLPKGNTFNLFQFLENLKNHSFNVEKWKREKLIEPNDVKSVGLIFPLIFTLIWIALWTHLSFAM